MCHTGFQYTPVASMATWVTASSESQADKSINPRVVLEKVFTVVLTWPSIWRTQATTVSL